MSIQAVQGGIRVFRRDFRLFRVEKECLESVLGLLWEVFMVSKV